MSRAARPISRHSNSSVDLHHFYVADAGGGERGRLSRGSLSRSSVNARGSLSPPRGSFTHSGRASFQASPVHANPFPHARASVDLSLREGHRPRAPPSL